MHISGGKGDLKGDLILALWYCLGWSSGTEYHQSGGVVGEKYRYMEDLLAFQACKPRRSCWVPGVLSKIQSPLSQRRATWEEALRGHPDRLFAHYICVGLQFGFRIGFGYNLQAG